MKVGLIFFCSVNSRHLLDIKCDLLSQLNIMLYDRRELSGQKNCHPAQVLGSKKEAFNPFILMDRYIGNQ